MKTYYNFNNTSEKRITFIMATKNRGKLLEKSLQQIVKLKTKQDEFILIDGGSNDRTREVVNKFRRYIDVFISEYDNNTNHAYNKGIMLSSGTYIKYLCDDDIVYKKPLEKAVKIMDQNPHIGLLVCGGTRYRKKTKKNQVVSVPSGVNYGNKFEDIFKYGTNGIGFLIRKSTYTQAGIAPFDWNADVTFAINCIKQGIVVKFCRLKLYHQTIYDFSINNSKKQEREYDYLKLLKENASPFFYWKFRFNLALYHHKYIALIGLPLFLIVKVLRKLFGSDKKNYTHYIWDGRFS